jgi:hypothetical protein
VPLLHQGMRHILNNNESLEEFMIFAIVFIDHCVAKTNFTLG